MACTYGGSNVVTVSKSTPLIRSALSCNKGHHQKLSWRLRSLTLTMLFEAMYWILRRSIARIIDCIAMKMFWYTSLMKPRLSSSEYPLPWIIRICLMNVDLPDSPVPVSGRKYGRD